QTILHPVAGPAKGQVAEMLRQQQQGKTGGPIERGNERPVVRARVAPAPTRPSIAPGASRERCGGGDDPGGKYGLCQKPTAVDAWDAGFFLHVHLVWGGAEYHAPV